MTFALFGIENDGLNLAVNLLVFFLFVIYVALVYWTYADASRRLEDPLLVACATVAAMFPFIGTIVYTIVRPPEYLEDRHEREIEVKAAEKRLALLENRTCRNCGGEVEPTFLRCPSCMRKLKEPCRNCGKPLDPRWRVCPYCESEVAGFRAGAVERPRRSRREQEREDRRRAAGVAGGAGATRSQESTLGREPRPWAQRPRDEQRRAPCRSAGGRADVTASSAEAIASRAVSRTLILIKPDAFERRLTGEILARFERKGLRIAALKLMQVDRDLAEQHYGEHSGKPFFPDLIEFITRGSLVAMVLEGEDAVPPPIPDRGHQPDRGGAGIDPRRLRARADVQPRHGSDSDATAEREIGLWFPELIGRRREAADIGPSVSIAAAERDPRPAGDLVRGHAGGHRGARRRRSTGGGARERAAQGTRGGPADRPRS